MAKNETAAPVKAAPEAVYTREQVMSSQRYANRRDLVSVLLEDGKQYTLGMSESQVQTLLGAMETALPGTVLGYSDELAGLYRNNRDFFSQRWEEKAPGCTARK